MLSRGLSWGMPCAIHISWPVTYGVRRVENSSWSATSHEEPVMCALKVLTAVLYGPTQGK